MPGPIDLVGKRVLVVGLARSGLAAAKLAAQSGARVTATDRRAATELSGALEDLAGAKVELALGGHDENDFVKSDLVVLSPGVPASLPELQAAKRAGVPVVAEVELAWSFLSRVPLVAITGTNGKSTTTALTGALCKEDRRAFVGGNLGTPLCEAVLSGRQFDVVVAELSSFQLEGIAELRPHVAAVLNVTPDHLDRYPGVDAYAEAKARIFMNQREDDFAVGNARDARTAKMVERSKGAKFLFAAAGAAPRTVRDDGELVFTGGDGREERYALASRALRGQHNRDNAMAAIACARLAGVPPEAVQRGLDGFEGLPHRLELVRELDGVEWVNDSKATNVDSTAVGLAAFEKKVKPNVVVIMGGRGKGAPYSPLAPLFAGRVKALLTVGEDAPKIEEELGKAAPLVRCKDLATAVKTARGLGKPGDVVLLSPACASYDQFKNYEQRGDSFRRMVKELA